MTSCINCAHKRIFVKGPSLANSFTSGYRHSAKSAPLLGTFVDQARKDPALILVNIGALFGLASVSMSDVMYLRLFGMAGGICNMTYNMTRVPKQVNATCWGMVFFLINSVMVLIL